MAEPLSELQGRIYFADLQRRKYLLEQLRLKRQLERLLEEEMPPLEEQRHEEALRIVVNNIQKFRVSGLL